MDDQGPRLALFYLTLTLSAGLCFIVLLGWGWPALVLTAFVPVLVAGALFYRRGHGRGFGRRQGDQASSTRYDDARTKTVEQKTRMRLDSKGPLGG